MPLSAFMRGQMRFRETMACNTNRHNVREMYVLFLYCSDNIQKIDL